MRFAVLVLGICGVASAALFARYGLQAGLSPVALSAWRLALASLALVAFAAVKKQPLPEKSDMWRLAAAGIFLALHFATWIASLDYVSVARSTLLVATSPLWAGLLGIVVPSLRPKPMFWGGLAIAGIGTWLVTMNGSTSHPVKTPVWMGDLLATIGAVCIVPYLLVSQNVQRRIGTLATITWIYGSATVALWLYLVGAGQAVVPTSQAAWISILGMALFAQLLGHSMLNLSLKFFSAAQVASTTLLEPVFAALLAWLLLGESIPAMEAIGAAILLVGLAVTLQGEEPIKSAKPD